jgi:alpha-L-rhamnosidase
MKVVSKVLFLFSVLFSLQSSGQVIVDHLTTEMAENPLVVNQKTPKLGWQLVSKNNNVSQKYYQILVASSEAIIQNNEGDVWNSGKVKSAKSQQVYYAGKALKEGTKYFWKVKIWDQNEVVSTWSKSAFFRTAPDEKELNPTWIGAILKSDSHLPEGRNYHAVTFKKEKKEAIVNAVDTLARKSIILRKTFSISKKIKEAVVYVSGLGHYELTMNGKKVGNSQFAPLWTDYDKTVYYNLSLIHI